MSTGDSTGDQDYAQRFTGDPFQQGVSFDQREAWLQDMARRECETKQQQYEDLKARAQAQMAPPSHTHTIPQQMDEIQAQVEAAKRAGLSPYTHLQPGRAFPVPPGVPVERFMPQSPPPAKPVDPVQDAIDREVEKIKGGG